MLRFWRVLLLGLILVPGPLGMAADSTAQMDLPLRSLLVRERDVFACNEAGLFRASKSDGHWRPLPLPDGMPPNGFFATEPVSAPDLWYYAPNWVLAPAANSGKLAGLYRSRDDGQHWQLVTSVYDLRDVFLHPNGTLYAIIRVVMKKPEATTIRDRIIMSRDEGQSWTDITGTLGPGIGLSKIMADPDHPPLVIMLAESMRAIIAQAQDERYQWELTREWDWMEQHMTDEVFFYRDYSTGATLYMFPATLSNYFQYDFGSRADLPAFDIVPDRSSYTFAMAEPKRISVAVRFLPSEPKVKLIDLKDQVGFWGLRVIDPKGRRTRVLAPLLNSWRASGQKPEDLGRIRRSKEFGVHLLSAQQPYLRSIDLEPLYSFDEKGTYRVQLQYDSFIADRQRGEWPGSFTGSVFEVVIR
jgi:hypothetical protein